MLADVAHKTMYAESPRTGLSTAIVIGTATPAIISNLTLSQALSGRVLSFQEQDYHGLHPRGIRAEEPFG